MQEDNLKYLLSLIAILATTSLVLIYVFMPIQDDSSRLHILLIDCIPDTLVALTAIPVVYWLFYRRGLVGIQGSPLALVKTQNENTRVFQTSVSGEGFMQFLPDEVDKAASKDQELISERDVLIVVDVQHDLITGPLKAHDASEIIQPLNAAIHIAESKGMLVVFTKDWHPKNHWSFIENGGPWATHCVIDTPGADLSPDLYRPPFSTVIEFGVYPGTLGYSPLENHTLDMLISSPQVRSVYIAGIALEYCVQATCRAVLERKKKTIALENIIATASNNIEETEKIWKELVNEGVVRERHYKSIGERTGT